MSLHFTAPSDVVMPPMIYGTAWKKEHTADLVYQAVKAGFRGIDTACQPKHYHEAGVGEALARLFAEGLSRDDLFIQTKFTPLGGQDPNRVPYDPSQPLDVQVRQSFERSQKNLRCDIIDSLVLHSPLFPFAQLMTVWNSMEQIAVSGKARQLGISNCYDLAVLQRLYDEATIKPSVVQNRFYDDSGYDVELRAWCNEKGIIYQSFWTLTANPHLLAHPTLKAIADEHGMSVVQAFYRYMNHIGCIPLNGTTSAEHMAHDLHAADYTLTTAQVDQITALLSS
jgi:diketogulonate reductase-like aldo/keto reductase